MALVNIKIKFNSDGSATITKDGEMSLVTDPAKLAELTEKVAKALGPVIERHALHSHIRLTEKGFKNEEHLHE